MEIQMAKYLGRLGRSRRSLRRPLAGLDRRSSRVTTGINERNTSKSLGGINDKWFNFF
jgi:hypothetical protein